MAHVDLDAILDGEQGMPFTFTFGGEEYSLPPQMDLRIGILLEKEKVDEAFRMMLGEEQWERLLASPQTLTPDRFKALMGEYSKHQGLTPGESPASAASSLSTATPQRPTLPGTTSSTSTRMSVPAA